MEKLHIGIILDGNRRFAKKLMKKPWEGHNYGAEKVENLFDWCKELNVRELTLYCLSIENFTRPKIEFDYLINLFKKYFSDLKNNRKIHENMIKIRFAGKRDLLDDELQQIMKELEDMTRDYENFVVNFALAYGGRQEILEAVKKMIENKKEVTEENFQDSLWIKDEPDLIIRTGGEKRTSNFLPWQATYSEWIFLDKMWPEFTQDDLEEAIKEFLNRKRNFGR